MGDQATLDFIGKRVSELLEEIDELLSISERIKNRKRFERLSETGKKVEDEPF
jgi:hypothetical protein